MFTQSPQQRGLQDNGDKHHYGILIQLLRAVTLVVLFSTGSVMITSTQIIGYPLYYVSPDLYHAWIDRSKQSFGILLTVITQVFCPTNVHITGDQTLSGRFRLDHKGNLQTNFGDRAVVISNHQLYSDWVFLWWMAFTAHAHGGVYIILKESLRKIPVLGWGMKNYRFLFLSRKWENDEQVLTKGLGQINREADWPAWLILFPEGTTLSVNGHAKSESFAKKQDLTVPEYVLLPRSKGLRFSIEKLAESVEYLYDATIVYSGIKPGFYGEDYFTLKRIYLLGEHPNDVYMHWKRYKISEIPYRDEAEFEAWLYKLWYTKEKMINSFKETGFFEAAASQQLDPLTTKIRLQSWFQTFQIVSVPVTTVLLFRLAYPRVIRLISSIFH